MAETEYLIRSFGYMNKPEDLAQAVLKSVEGTPVTVGDVARVVEGPAIRRGITELNGAGEAVGGIIVMRPGANALDVIHNVKERLESVRQGLPDGVEIKAVYDRSALIEGSVEYLKGKLIEESLIVALIRARMLSVATMNNIRQNLFFAFIYNVVGMPIAAGVLYPVFGILLSPIIAAAAMSLSSLSVIGNALRLKLKRL